MNGMKGIRRDGNFGEYIREEGECGNEDVLYGKEEKLYVSQSRCYYRDSIIVFAGRRRCIFTMASVCTTKYQILR